MTAAETELRVIGDVDDPREGLYLTVGTIDGVPVTLDWELYLNGLPEASDGSQRFSTFLEGDWVLGPYDAWITGTFSDATISTFIEQPTGGVTPEGDPEVRRWEIVGALSPTGSTTLTVREGGLVVGTLTATKL
jgi:hypothetical protein